jgi:hypothetical protein
MNSALVGVESDATATLTVIAAFPLLQILKVTTEKVSAGTVYSGVLVAAVKSAAPNLPVAMF